MINLNYCFVFVCVCVKVSPDSFCNLWVQDMEYVQNPCIALAAYVALCNKFNICIEWRSSNYCRKYFVFRYYVCRDPSKHMLMPDDEKVVRSVGQSLEGKYQRPG